uniref:Nucleoporin 50 n=1 Tax=Lates calcarifer TaxID=8187 RepID=A0A4W6CJT9_LATCA
MSSRRCRAEGGEGVRGGLQREGGGAPRFSSSSSCNVSPSIISGLTFNGPASAKPTADITAKQTNGSTPSPTQSSGSSNKEYSRQLTALNCSVRDWITKHVNDNPLCDLNPIFRDYERHLASIERQYGAGSSAAPADGGSEEKKQGGKLPTTASPPPPSSTSTSSSSSSSSAAPAAAASLFSFSKKNTEDSSLDKTSSAAPIPAGVTFNFGQKVDSSVLGSLGSKTTTPSFSFSSSSGSSSGQTSLFGAAGSAAPLSFSGTKAEDARPAGTPTGFTKVLRRSEEADRLLSDLLVCKGQFFFSQSHRRRKQLLIRAAADTDKLLLIKRFGAATTS